MDAKQTIVRQILSNFVMFSALPEAEKQALAGLFEVNDYQPNSVIAEQNTDMSLWHIIHSGRVRLKKTENGKRRSIGELGKDASFGERCLIEAERWPFEVITTENTTTLSLPGDKVRALQKQYPEIG
ncbi:MAG: cyclic nucleotide-binding domain-containing protein, partial [Gammaproteobacteria bacterium]|nr:cyclic nucleotide-binding domain-containing protein [Gammaproteobacteria bacterium]